jgi:FkbM family methyltransferase
MQIARHGGKAFIYRTASGDRFVCIPGSSTSEQLFLSDERYEESELHCCVAWLERGDACLDVGANIGQFSAPLADAVGPSGRVVAIEPAPDTVAHLRTTIRCLGLSNVAVEPACATHTAGEVEFRAAAGNTCDIVASMKVGKSDGTFRTVRVPGSTLDEIADRHGIRDRVALIKMDVEGAEPLALQGGERLLAGERLPLFVVEIHRHALSNYGFSPADVLRFFPQERFDLFHVQRSRSDLAAGIAFGVPYRLSEPFRHPWPWNSNLIAVPRVGIYSCRQNRLELLRQG